ncbi:MAG: hypothetical protein KKA59_08435 [Candidatus Omnitrophica bacterium]|nr:hypothetical protein [Candidatus Omnitrophota bacterium]
MQSYRFYLAVAGRNMRPLFVKGERSYNNNGNSIKSDEIKPIKKDLAEKSDSEAVEELGSRNGKSIAD